MPCLQEGFIQDTRRHRPSFGFHLKATISMEKTWWSRLLLGTKPKKLDVQRKQKIVEGSDTQRSEEIETEHEMDSCQQFRNLMLNIKLMDKELALVCAENLSEQFHFIFLDRKNIDAGIENLTVGDKMKITCAIFISEKENVNLRVTLHPALKHTNISLHCSKWHRMGRFTHRTLFWPVQSSYCAMRMPSHFKRAVATDQLYSLVSPSFVSPLLFATNLVAHSVTWSKLALNINGKLHPAGGHSTVRNWLNNLTMTVPEFPSGDLLPAIDNDQVLIKKWTVRKDNRAQISVLTSLPPRNWFQACKSCQRESRAEEKNYWGMFTIWDW